MRLVKTSRGSAIDGRTTRWLGYTISQRIRKRVEEIFGWSWVDLGSSLPRPPGRSGRAQFGHPAPQITDSRRQVEWTGMAGGSGRARRTRANRSQFHFPRWDRRLSQ